MLVVGDAIPISAPTSVYRNVALTANRRVKRDEI